MWKCYLKYGAYDNLVWTRILWFLPKSEWVQGCLRLSLLPAAAMLGFSKGSLEQQHQYHLRTRSKCRISDPTTDPLTQKLWGGARNLLQQALQVILVLLKFKTPEKLTDNCESHSHGPHSSSWFPVQLAITQLSLPPEPSSHLLTLG